MDSIEYLDIRKRQDSILSEIGDETPIDDPKIAELLSLQDRCEDFEREYFHKGYDQISVDLGFKELVELIRKAHASGMNLSDYISSALCVLLDVPSFSWTTDIRHPDSFESGMMPFAIPEHLMKKFRWRTGDFIRVTIDDKSLTLNKINLDNAEVMPLDSRAGNEIMVNATSAFEQTRADVRQNVLQDLSHDETNEICSEVDNEGKELIGDLFSIDHEPTEEELDAVMEAAARVAAERNREAERKLFEEIEMEIKKLEK